MTQEFEFDDDARFWLMDAAATVSALVRRLPDAELRERRFGEWSAKDVLGHIADWAEIFASRIEQCTREDEPALVSYDQDELVAEHRDDGRDAGELGRRIVDAHRRIGELAADPAVAQRAAVHPERGRVTASWLAAYHAQHAREHADDLSRAFPPR